MLQSRFHPAPLLLSIPLLLIAAAAAFVAIYTSAEGVLEGVQGVASGRLVNWHIQFAPAWSQTLAIWELREARQPLATLMPIVAGFCAIVGTLGIIRIYPTLLLLRAAYVVAIFGALIYILGVNDMTSMIVPLSKEIEGFGDDVKALNYDITMLRFAYWAPAIVAILTCIVLFFASYRSDVMALFGRNTAGHHTVGDRFFENFRTHGRDPEYRRSTYRSAFIHLLIILIIPWLLDFLGCITPYRLPLGEGSPTIATVQAVQQTVEQKQQIILNPNSPIWFNFPELDDNPIERQVDADSMAQYSETTSQGGALGGGEKGDGGWPEGWPDGMLRLIRMNHGGSGWDDGMSPRTGNADANFLAWFKRNSGANFPVARNSEHHAMHLLTRYPRGQAPPFVYIAGDGAMRYNQRDVQAMRSYLLEHGGMLFADAGSPQFHRSFMSFMRQVLPGHTFRDIADDDPIYRFPYRFPNGAPPLWHHGGFRALGIRHTERGASRWVVFYHPGDIHDAWKDGNSGLDAHTARRSFELGTNVIYYAVTNYIRLNREYMR